MRVLVAALFIVALALADAAGSQKKKAAGKKKQVEFEVPRLFSDHAAYFDAIRAASAAAAPAAPGDREPAPRSSAGSVADTILAMAKEMMTASNIPGMGITVVQNGQTVVTEGLGVKNDLLESVTADTNFFIGSTSKAFTSTLVGQLVDEGRLDLNAPVFQYFAHPFTMQDPVATAAMTARDMLTHHTGMPNHGHDLATFFSNYTREELVYRLKYAQPQAGLRQYWFYSNLMVMAAGYLAEELRGAPWEQIVDELIFTPLEMARTFTSVDDVVTAGDYADPYITLPNGQLQSADLNVENYIQVEGPAGIISSTANDLTNWLHMHLNGGVGPHGERIISNDTLALLHTAQANLAPLPTSSTFFRFFSPLANQNVTIGLDGYAFCWMEENYRGYRHVWHDGAVFGQNAQVSLVPEQGIGIAIVANRDNVNTQLSNLARYIIDVLTGMPAWLSPSLARTAHQRLAALPRRSPLPVPPLSPAVAAAAASIRRADALTAHSSSQQRRASFIPSRPLSDYINTYHHPFYGTIQVSAADNSTSLTFTWTDKCVGNMTVLADNVFFVQALVEYFPPSDLTLLQATFFANSDNVIDSVGIPMTNFIAPIVFTTAEYTLRGVAYPNADD